MRLDQTPGRRLLVAGLITLMAVAVTAVVAVPAGLAQVVEPTTTTADTTTTTTTPPETTTTTTTTTTTEPPTTTTTPEPSTTTTTSKTSEPSTTAPATTTTVPPPKKGAANPYGEASGLNPDQVQATKAAFAALSDTQRRLLAELESAQDTLATRQIALVTLIRDTQTARTQLDAARTRAAAAAAELHPTAVRISRVKHEIVRLAVVVYRSGPATASLSALDTNGASEFARAQTYAQSDANVLDSRVVELEALTTQLKNQRATAKRAAAQAETDAATLDQHVADQNQAVKEAATAAASARTAITNALGSGASLLAQVAAPSFGGDDIAATLEVSQAGQPDPTQLVGIFRLPIADASFSSPFGMRIDPINGGGGFHPGVDFGAPEGTPIHAAGAGLVVVAGDCGGYGNCVVIDHGTKLATIYGHQSALVAKVGDHVVAGQVIGLVGSTGLSTGPHLHFEVRLRGVPIDPVPTLGAEPASP